jgi:hypothetical protein
MMFTHFLSALIFSLPVDSAEVTGVLVTDPALPAKMNLVWIPNEQGFEELFVNTQIDFGPEYSVSNLIPSLGSKILGIPAAGQLHLLIPGTKELLQDQAGNRIAALSVQNLSAKLITKNCAGLDVELLETEQIPDGLYIGIFCSLGENQSLRFWITAPSDVGWGETSIFEQAGKGERWRGYAIQNFTPIQNELLHATFRFSTENTSFGLKLVQKPNAELLAKEREAQEKIVRLEEEKQISELRRQETEWRKQKLERENTDLQEKAKAAEERERIVKASISLGGLMIDVKTKTAKAKSFQALFSLDGSTKPLLYTLGFGGGFKYAPPIGKMSLWDLSLQLQSTWNLGQFVLRPGLGFHTFGLDYSAKKLAFRHSSLAFDFFAQYGQIHQFWLLLSTSGLLPPGDSRYLSGSFGYRFPLWRFLNAGPRLTYQLINYPDAEGKFQQMIAGFDVGF